MARQSGRLLNQGDVLNDTYHVVRFIGRGAFGEVYRVKHQVLGNQALKIFTTDYVENTDLRALASEALVLSRLTHKNIVRVFEANTFSVGGKRLPFMTMEFVSGESLAHLLKREIRLQLQTCISIQRALLSGLKETHSQNPPIVHRDISPDNILLSYDCSPPRALITDFGLAQSVDQLSHLSGVAGKYLYLAPECFWGAYLPTSDVFSAGVVFYRMLTGVFPWEYDFDELNHSSPDQVAMIIGKGQRASAVPPSKVTEDCPPEVDEIVLKSIATDLEHRYRDASEFLAALSSLADEVSGDSSAESSPQAFYV